MENLRIKEIAKRKEIQLQEIAERLNITYPSLNRRLKVSKLDTLVQIAEILNCELAELFKTSPEFSHFYDAEGKEWLGIRKK